MRHPLTNIAIENFKAGRYLSSVSRQGPSHWTYGGLPRSVSKGHNVVDHILARRAAARNADVAILGACRNLFAKFIRR